SHGERGAREVVHLHGYGDEQHPPGDERDGLPGPESPEGRRDAERRHVHRRAGEESTDRRWPCDGRHSPTRSTTSVSPSTERTRTVSPTSAVPSHRAAQISPPSFTWPRGAQRVITWAALPTSVSAPTCAWPRRAYQRPTAAVRSSHSSASRTTTMFQGVGSRKAASRIAIKSTICAIPIRGAWPSRSSR